MIAGSKTKMEIHAEKPDQERTGQPNSISKGDP